MVDKKPKSIFDENSLGASRSDINDALRKTYDKTRSSGTHIMDIREKRFLGERVLPKAKYGEHISAEEIKHEIATLKKLKSVLTRTGSVDKYGASEVQDKIDFLENLMKK